MTASNLQAPATGNTYSGTSDFSNLTNYPAVRDGWLYKIYGSTWTSNSQNVKATEYLLDSSIWNEKYKNSYAKWAIGAPTMELLVASYNAVNTPTISIEDLNTNGYPQTISSGLINTSSRPWNHGTPYWLACPSGRDGWRLRFVAGNEVINNYYGGDHVNDSKSFRPVVCLKSNVILTENESGTFDISFAE